MHFTSERLIYTKVVEADLDNYLSWYTHDTVMKYITGRGLTEREAEARFLKTLKTNAAHPEAGFFTVCKKEDSTFVGFAKLTYENDTQAEAGYGLMPPFWGQKYATEMLVTLIEYARTIPRIQELIAIVDPENPASIKVLTNQGFTWYMDGEVDGRPALYYKLGLGNGGELRVEG